MKKFLLSVVLFSLHMLFNPASASTAYLEDFEGSFPSWESGWLGQNSSLMNYYGVGAGRGNNPDGLWIYDGISGDGGAHITFNSAFGSQIQSFSIDIASYIRAHRKTHPC
ncbi:MAG: hypothetical protein FJ190_06975 [Gammaproteobacteria bacterium]|nr:hypothetical protein [Gammaproteobacteria bacterium]